MKRIIFAIAMLISLEGIGQHTAGLKFFGLNWSESYTGSNFGLFYRFDLSDRLAIQVEPSYSDKGVKTDAVYLFEYLESPELLYFTPVKDNFFFDLHSGINLKYLLNAKSVSEHAVKISGKKTQLEAIIGGSIGWRPNRISIAMSARYNYDITGTWNNGDRINTISLLIFAGYSF